VIFELDQMSTAIYKEAHTPNGSGGRLAGPNELKDLVEVDF
jgi:hypothetical protein